MLATETISPNGQKIEAASLWFLKEKCFKAHSPLWSKWNKAFSDTYKASWKQHQHIAAFISFIRIFSQTGSFLPWLCYTAFCVDTNISASFAWWFRGSVQAGKGAQVPCSSIPLFLHTVIIAEIEHSFCSMLLLPKKEPRGSKANHSSLQDELPGCCLARWWSPPWPLKGQRRDVPSTYLQKECGHDAQAPHPALPSSPEEIRSKVTRILLLCHFSSYLMLPNFNTLGKG